MTAATPQGTADAPAARGGAGAAHGSTAQGSTAPETTSGSTAPGAAAAETVLEAERISLAFGGVRALTDVSFHVRKGELFSIIGPNGAGKTSMVNCISGRYSPTEGRILFKGQDITRLKPNARADLGIGRTFQNLALFGHMSVLDNIMVGRHHLLKNNFVTGAFYWFTGARKEELAHRREVEDIIDFLEIQHVRRAMAGTLPYGLRKRVELARAIALKPDLLLLDEPMAGMNLEEKEDMARFVIDLNEEWGMTVIMIEHDMGVVMDISNRVMVLDFGRKLIEGSPEDALADPRVRSAYLGEVDDETAAAIAGDEGDAA
jgi:branched-chain amino acid transport system ATP-binding protein